MLLNELKQVFETDRDVIGGTLQAFGLNFDRDIGGAGNSKGGDVDNSLKNVVERCVVIDVYVPPTKDEIDKLTAKPEAKEKTIESLGNLAGTLRRLQDDFTSDLIGLKGRILPAVTATGATTIKDWVQSTLISFNNDLKSRPELITATKNTLQANRDNLVRTLMKLANTESYGRQTIEEIKNFTGSNEWFEDSTKTTIKSTGLAKLRSMIEQFYAVLVTLQQNTAKLTQTFTAAMKTPPP